MPSPQQDLPDLQLLTVRDVAELLGVSQRTVWRLAITGHIPEPIRIGPRLKRWRAADLEAHLAALRPKRGGRRLPHPAR